MFGFVIFLFVIVRGVPLRMGLARFRRKTFVILDHDTHYTAPRVKKEGGEVVETKNEAWGKAFRVKILDSIKLGFAVPYEFVMTEPEIAAAVEEDNKTKDNPDDYITMENSLRQVRIAGRFVKLSEFTKGLEDRTVPVLVKGAMSRAAQEARAETLREPTKYGMMILMVLLGLGIFLMFAKKAGVI
jgi:hypothetical protein